MPTEPRLHVGRTRYHPGTAGTYTGRPAPSLARAREARAYGLTSPLTLLEQGINRAVLLAFTLLSWHTAYAVGGSERLATPLALHLGLLRVLCVAGFAFWWPNLWSTLPWRRRRRRVVGAKSRAVAVNLSGGVLVAAAILLPISSAQAVVRVGVGLLLLGPVSVILQSAVASRLAARRAEWARPTIIVGGGPRAESLYRELSTRPELGLDVVGYVEERAHPRSREAGFSWLGVPEGLQALLAERRVEQVLIALPIRSHYAEIQQVIRACEVTGIECRYRADVFEFSTSHAAYGRSGRPYVALLPFVEDWRLLLKFALDRVAALAGLLVLAPLLIGIAAAIRLTSPGPALFLQERVGHNRRKFPMFKFRTMVVDADKLQPGLEQLNEAGGPRFKIRDDPRITPFGHWLRRTSLDELPQLLNVLRGEMSLVGPRPLPLRDLQHFDQPWLLRRFSVRPGLTGLWQVYGRGSLGLDDWIALDLEYVDHWSLTLDVRILARTPAAVWQGEGAV